MTTRETYSAILTLAAVAGLAGLAGWSPACAFIAGMAFSHVNLDWIPAEPLDEE